MDYSSLRLDSIESALYVFPCMDLERVYGSFNHREVYALLGDGRLVVIDPFTGYALLKKESGYAQVNDVVVGY